MLSEASNGPVGWLYSRDDAYPTEEPRDGQRAEQARHFAANDEAVHERWFAGYVAPKKILGGGWLVSRQLSLYAVQIWLL